MSLIHDLFSWLLAFFVIAPLQAEFEEQLQITKVPPTIIVDVKACVQNGAAALVNRASNDIWWGIDTTARVALGFKDAREVLASATPECGAAITAVKPFLDSPEV